MGYTQPPVEWVPWTVYQRVKRSGSEADHSPPSSAEVKNGGAIPPLRRPPPIVFMAWCVINSVQGQLHLYQIMVTVQHYWYNDWPTAQTSRKPRMQLLRNISISSINTSNLMQLVYLTFVHMLYESSAVLKMITMQRRTSNIFFESTARSTVTGKIHNSPLY
jgi:hypothetical protein